jgi:hypothetical protein
MLISDPDKEYIGGVLKSTWFLFGVILGFAGLVERLFATHTLIPPWAIIAVFMLFLAFAQFKVYKKRFNDHLLEMSRRKVLKQKLAEFTKAEKEVLKLVLYGGGEFKPVSLPDGLDHNSIMPAINKAIQTGLMEEKDGKIFFPHALETTLAFVFENEDWGEDGERGVPDGRRRAGAERSSAVSVHFGSTQRRASPCASRGLRASVCQRPATLPESSKRTRCLRTPKRARALSVNKKRIARLPIRG